MGAGEPLCAVDGEAVGRVGGDGGVFGGEGDVEAADAEVRVLHVEVVGVAHGAVLRDGDADVACWVGQFFFLFSFFLFFSAFVCFRDATGGHGDGFTHCSSMR